MRSIYEPLGKYIRYVDERNMGIVTKDLQGISIDKFFMPSVGNVIGTDLSKYKLLRKGRFACNPMHVGRDEKLPVSLFDKDEPAIVSPAYFMFEINDDKLLDSEYLMLCFRRPDFDHKCWFRTDASVRGGLSWDDLCSITIPIPSISEQRRIVYVNNVICKRIGLLNELNQNLQEQAKAIYSKMIIESADESWTPGVLSDIATIIMGQSPNGDTYNETGDGTVFFQGRAEFGFRFPTRRLFTTDPKRMANANDALMSVRAPVGDMNVAYEDCCIGRGLSAIRSKDGHQSFVLYTMFDLRGALEVFNGEGTVFGSINRDALNSLSISIPPKTVMDEFESIVAPIDATIRNNCDEIFRLEALRDILLPKLMSGELDVSELEL